MLGNSVLSCCSDGSLLQCFHMQLQKNICLLLESPSLSPHLCAEGFFVTFHPAGLRGSYWLSLLKHTLSKLLLLTCDSFLASPASGIVCFQDQQWNASLEMKKLFIKRETEYQTIIWYLLCCQLLYMKWFCKSVSRLPCLQLLLLHTLAFPVVA